jgi:transcriptional regulator with XRE-family HTH domain
MEIKKLTSIIKTIRSAKGYTHEYMAHQLNITASAYSKIEKGNTKLNIETLEKISSILEIPLIDLLKATDDQNFVFINCNNSIGLNSHSPIHIKETPTQLETITHDVNNIKALLDFILKEIQYLKETQK